MRTQIDNVMKQGMRVHVLGRVQGVGFRPFVARLAGTLCLAGWVKNTPEGVVIQVEGPEACLSSFCERLRQNHPPAAEIHELKAEHGPAQGHVGFTIEESETCGGGANPGATVAVRVVITPDLAACSSCVAEFDAPDDRRHGFALSGCTDCGPRFSIQTSAPFDRERTTMSDFPPCSDCEREYLDLADRRFHAQIVSCPQCGPRIWLEPAGEMRNAEFGMRNNGGRQEHDDKCPNPHSEVPIPHSAFRIPHSNDLPVLDHAAALLRQGAILALKGIGGFHLLCDATAPEVVRRLRERKQRDRKPFAVLFLDVEQLAAHAELDAQARALLLDPAAPIVLLSRRSDSTLAPEIAPGLSTVGAFLAYTPLHRALVFRAGRPLVATSANLTDEPMPVDNEVARSELRSIADWMLLHDRRILRHSDDSVVRLIGGTPVPIRIGRGLAPLRIVLPIEPPPLLATGGHLKAAVALTRGRELFLGQHIGDLDTPTARRRYQENATDLPRLFGVTPSRIVHDLHPDYFTTRFAQDQGMPLLAVQHHHAHIMACLAEHGESGPALGISWDGTGYGDDGTIWGGEFLVVDGADYRRIGSLWPFRLVGGDRAAREPRRSAAGVCFSAGVPLPDEAGFSEPERRFLVSALRSHRASITTTSAGRLFDAWASLLGITQFSAYEAEAAMRLEERADPNEQRTFEVSVLDETGSDGHPLYRIDWRPWLAETLRLRTAGRPTETLVAMFHNSLAAGSVELARRSGLHTVVLSGGCFQNRLLAERVALRLRYDGFRVLTCHRVPPGDGGLAVGQIWAAALILASS
jgi:hydrogenase maturation protein HypF